MSDSDRPVVKPASLPLRESVLADALRYPRLTAVVREALEDARVAGALTIAVRDAVIRADFEGIKEEGCSAEAALAELAEHHALSVEHVKTIVYRKPGWGGAEE
jgi:hypothetical protein